MPLIFGHAVKYGGRYYPPNTPIEQPPQKATASASDASTNGDGGNTNAKPEAARKAAKSRKKGDA